MAPDSYDWIANGFYYASYDVTFSLLRPPGLPLIIMMLEKIRLLSFLPLLNQLVLLGIFITIYKVIAKYFNKITSIITVLILFTNFFLQDLSVLILADLYALFFILLGLFFYLKAEKERKFYITSSLFWSISFLFQYAIVSLAPAFLLHFLLFRRKISLKIATLSALPPFLLIGSWYVLKKLFLEPASIQNIDYINLVKPHLDSLFFYLINIISVLGIFAFILLVIGFLKIYFDWKRKNNSAEIHKFILLSLLAIVSWFIFWVLLYDWNDRRFVVYLLPFLVPFIVVAVGYLLNSSYERNIIGRIFAVVIILFSIVWSAIPYESALSFDTLKLTRLTGIRFKTVIDESSSKGNISISSAQLDRKLPSFINPLNLKSLAFIKKNAAHDELTKLDKIKNNIFMENKSSICIGYEKNEFDGARWYIDKNKYGNYFRKKVILYPKCDSLDLVL
jgi:hypothetical protein